MKNANQSVCLPAGRGDENTSHICRSLTPESISAVARQKDAPESTATHDHIYWSGQPGQDLFFNGWKLIF